MSRNNKGGRLILEIRMILVCSIGYILGMAVFEFLKEIFTAGGLKNNEAENEREANDGRKNRL